MVGQNTMLGGFHGKNNGFKMNNPKMSIFTSMSYLTRWKVATDLNLSYFAFRLSEGYDTMESSKR